MTPDWIIFLGFTFLSIAVQGLFVLFEMAALSLSRIRLQYEVSLGKKRALWLNTLLERPSRFFGTTLIGINAALQIGSECSRKFYEAVHLDSDWAPITQVVLVVMLAELSPMFAARRHPSQIALSLSPFMMLLSRVFLPIIWMFDGLSQLIHRFMGKAKEGPLFFSREELSLTFEEREEGEDELNALTRQIFQLKNQTAEQIMKPLENVLIVPSSATFSDVQNLLSSRYEPVILMYRHQKRNIIAVVHIRDLLRLEDNEQIFPKTRSPWFVTKTTSILGILDQFRRNNQSVAVILDPSGQACGLLTLDQIVDQIFGQERKPVSPEEESSLHVERTLSGEMTVAEFNQEFQADLNHPPEDTLSMFIFSALGHLPVKGEIVRVESFVFTVLEPTLRGVKTLSVCSD